MTAQREALRQQMLLRAVWRDAAPQSLRGWVRAPAERGLAAYRANAGALAERALGAAFPTIAALVGAESFAALARDFWQRHPPVRGDLGEWGAALPAFIADNTQLASEPYLADVARLEWAVHRATRAADAPPHALSLDALASSDAARLRVELAPGSALIASRWPVAAIWQAHRPASDDERAERFAAVRAAFDAERGDNAFVWRDGFAVHVAALDAADAAFTTALVAARPLAGALDAAGPSFAFDRWLARAVTSRWLVALHPLETP